MAEGSERGSTEARGATGVASAPERAASEELRGRARDARRVIVDPAGPILVEGPVEVHAVGEEPLLVERFLVAVCTCRRSRRYPLCDGSHRRV